MSKNNSCTSRLYNADLVLHDIEQCLKNVENDILDSHDRAIKKYVIDYNKSLGWCMRHIFRMKPITEETARENMDTFDRFSLTLATSSQKEDRRRLEALQIACESEAARREISLSLRDICLIEYWKDHK